VADVYAVVVIPDWAMMALKIAMSELFAEGCAEFGGHGRVEARIRSVHQLARHVHAALGPVCAALAGAKVGWIAPTRPAWQR